MIVGLVGFIGSGKNTAAEYFVELGYQQDSFARTLKDICAILFSWPRDLLEGVTKESRLFRETIDVWWADKLNIPNFTPRLALQLLGTDVLRNNFHPDIWLLTLQRRYDSAKNVIVTDARFPNEQVIIRKLGGKIIFVDNGIVPEWYNYAYGANIHNDETDKKFMRNQFQDVHYSEWAWIGSDFDYVIENKGSLLDLKTSVANCISNINVE